MMRSSLSCALYPVSGFRYPVSGLAFSLSLPTRHYAAPYTPYRRSRAEYHREDLFRDSADLSSDAWRPSPCRRRSPRPASAHTCAPAQSPALKLRKRPVGSCCVTNSITRRPPRSATKSCFAHGSAKPLGSCFERFTELCEFIAPVHYDFVIAVWRATDTESRPSMKYWEIVADNLSKAGWSWGCVSGMDSKGRTIFVADPRRGDNQWLIVRADEKLTAFLELQSEKIAHAV